MIYKFVLLSDEVDGFFREISIDSEATFLELNDIIIDAVGYNNNQMASFFLCSDSWEKEQEITLVEMDTDSEHDSLVMESCVLSEFIDDEGQKLLYVFDYFAERSFFIELKEIVLSQSLPVAKCTAGKGNAPAQELSEDAMLNGTSATDFVGDESFFGDNEFDMDELDEEGFSGLDGAEGIAYEDTNF